MADSLEVAAGASRIIELDTPRGRILVRSHCDAAFVQGLTMDSGIGVAPQYRSMVWNRDMMARIAGVAGNNVVLAHTDDGRIVGYIIFGPPSRLERWGRMGADLIYELGSIEVSRNYRGLGVAREMMVVGMAEDRLDDKVVIATGFAWHWDTQASGTDKFQYRRRLMALFAEFGMRHFYTNEGNIILDTANFLMARIGSRVSEADKQRFLDIAFYRGLEDVG